MAEPSTAEVRAWARANGHAVADRGRIPAAVVAAHAAAQQAPPPAEGAVDRAPLGPRPRATAPPRDRRSATAADPPAPGAPQAGAPQAEAPAHAVPARGVPLHEGPSPGAPLDEAPLHEEPSTEAPLDEVPSHDAPLHDAPAPGPIDPAPEASWPAPWGAAPPSQPPAWGAPAGPPPPPPALPTWAAPAPGWGAPGSQPAPAATGRNGFSVAALVLGIFPFLGGLLGIIFGVVALGQIRRSRQSGRGMAIAGIVLGASWLLLIGVFVAIGVLSGPDRSADGTVTSGGSVMVSGLRVGDCSASLPQGQTRTVQLVPCTSPHRGEVYGTFRLGGSDFPGRDEAQRFAKGGCLDRLTAYVGPGRSSQLGIFYLIPTADGWRTGNHDVQCLLTAIGGGILPAGSAKAP